MTESACIRTLQAGNPGDHVTLTRLFTTFYGELQRRAHWELRQGHAAPLGPNTLLHETFLNIRGRAAVSFEDPRQFIAYAARAMRGLIIDHLRSHRAQKRGGRLDITSLPAELPHVADDARALQMEALGDALESLAAIDPRLAECVDLKFFCGLSFGQIARLRAVSERTVQRDWKKARLLLSRLIRNRPPHPDPDTA
ncbi:MAG TPA: ECF-type sigma factor [Steroidobacteraceae bacterium]|nr:ECF-type sigma factor [Steroidobacteraceae bacterium]